MKKRRILSILLALVMVFGLSVPALAVEVPEAGDSLNGTLVILHVNDSHGRDVASEGSSIGTAGVAQLKADYEAAGAEVLLVHAGDAVQGTPLVNFEYGKKAYEFMNLAGYDVAILGNHEFDWGTANLQEIAKTAEFPILAANVINDETGAPLFGDRMIVETEIGIKVGIFGLDTPETATKAHPDKVQGVSFLAGEEMFAAAQAQVDALKADGADLIVCIGHLGINDESIGNRSYDVIEAVDGIDLFIDGHSHNEINELVGSTLLVQTGEYLKNVGVVTYKDGTLSAGLIGAADYSKVDESVAAVINAYNDELSAQLTAAVVGTSEVLLNGERAPGVRTEETNLGDFAADAILWYARNELGEDAVDASVTNGGGIRDSIQAGTVTMQDMITVFPFGNTVATVTVTGAELLEAIEAATCTTPDAIGAFPQVSGLSFEIDSFVEYVNGEAYSTYFMPANPGSRVKNLQINGEPVDLEKTYVIATNDFVAAGGDTYGPFANAPTYNTGLTMEDALIQYTETALGGVISAAQYAQPAGRIVVNTEPSTADAWYTPAVNYVTAQSIMSATDLTANVTRATAFEVLYRLAGSPATSGESFDDVGDVWYAASAAWAKESGLTAGTENGYDGEREITRAELAKILVDYLGAQGASAAAADISGYADVAEVADWAADAVKAAVGYGIISGKSGNLLAPNASATRVELAQMLYNISTITVTESSSTVAVSGTVESVSKYGNLELNVTYADLIGAGFTVGDMLDVTINGVSYEMPFCTNYSDVDNGALVLRAQEESIAIVAINMGDFATTNSVAEGADVVITLKEAGAYLEEYEIRNLVRTDVRADYASDEVYANFRAVTLGNIAEGVLYRSSSPINEEINRASYADALAQAAGVKTFINLADDAESLQAHFDAETFHSPYYKSIYEAGGVITLSMGVDLNSEDFQAKLATGLAFLAEQKGPYLVHCNEGKDRAGFTIAVLEALMGASVEEIVEDYMVTYENYYGVEKNTTKYEKIAEGNIMESLRSICGLESGASLDGVDLVAATRSYLLGIGLTEAQITAIETNLSTPIAS